MAFYGRHPILPPLAGGLRLILFKNTLKAKENANAFAPYIPHLKEGVLRLGLIKRLKN